MKYIKETSRERNAKAGLKREDAHDRTKWKRCPDDSCEKHPATSVDGDKTD